MVLGYLFILSLVRLPQFFYLILWCQLVTQKEGEIDGSLLGANASQEEQTEDCEVTTITGFDFVIANRLKEMSIPDKKTCQLYFKDFFKA